MYYTECTIQVYMYYFIRWHFKQVLLFEYLMKDKISTGIHPSS